MANQRRGKNSGGFTIIEVLIVLAVAGLILAIVFLAIPTLQRNGRNNQRKQDVSASLEAVTRYRLNNSGVLPSSAELQSRINPTYYDKLAITITAQTPGAAGKGASTNVSAVSIYNYEKCDVDTLGKATKQGAGFSDVVALYALESNGGGISQCQQL